jgi:CheY-specific phosphatase CheX
MSMTHELDEKSIVKASAQFWEQMLSMHLEQLETACQCTIRNGDVVGSVALNGAWNGVIEIIMSGGLATTATAAMLMQPASAVTDADTLDAAKEIANMIAGTIKSALPRPCNMTVPRSGIHPTASVTPDAKTGSLQVALTHESGCLLIRVLGSAAAV